MNDDNIRRSGALRRATRRPGITLHAIELLSKLEADVASILGAPPVPVPRTVYGRSVSEQLRRGTSHES